MVRETAGISVINFQDLRWVSTSLLHNRTCQYSIAKSYVFSKLCALFGENGRQSCWILGEVTPIVLGQQLFQRIESNWCTTYAIRVEDFARPTTMRILSQIQQMMGELQCEPENCTGRIFMSMFKRHWVRSSYWPCAYSFLNQPQTLSSGSFVDAAGSTHLSRSREYPPFSQPGVPIFCGKVECSLVFLFEFVYLFGKIPRFASDTSLLSFSLFMGPFLKFRKDLADEELWHLFFPTMVLSFLSRILAWRSVDSVNRTLWIGSMTFCIGFPRDFLPWESSASESCDTQPNCATLYTIATACLSSLSLLFGKSLVILGLPAGFSGTVSQAHPRAITFPPRGRLLHGVTFLGPIRFWQHLFSVHDHGRLRSSWEPQLWPALTQAWLYIEPSPCGGVRPAGGPVDSDPRSRLRGRSPPKIERWSPARALSVCRHTREPTVVVQGGLPLISPEFWPFSPALPVTLAHFQERSALSVLRTTWRPPTLAGSPALPPLRLTGGSCHADSTTHSQKVIAHTQVRDPRESAAACCGACLGYSISLATSLSALYFVVHQPCDAETDTCLQPYNPCHFFIELAIERMPIFSRRSRASTFQIISLLLPRNFSSSTLFDLVKRLAQKVWRQCVLVFVHDLGFRDGNCIGLFANTGLFLSIGNRYLSLFQSRLPPLDSLSLPLKLSGVFELWFHDSSSLFCFLSRCIWQMLPHIWPYIIKDGRFLCFLVRLLTGPCVPIRWLVVQ